MSGRTRQANQARLVRCSAGFRRLVWLQGALPVAADTEFVCLTCSAARRLAEIESAANLIAGRLAEAVPAVVGRVVGDEPAADADDLYLALHGAREKLCRAQVLLGHGGRGCLARGNLGRAIALIDAVGAEWCTDQWSRFDQPTKKSGTSQHPDRTGRADDAASASAPRDGGES